MPKARVYISEGANGLFAIRYSNEKNPTYMTAPEVFSEICGKDYITFVGDDSKSQSTAETVHKHKDFANSCRIAARDGKDFSEADELARKLCKSGRMLVRIPMWDKDLAGAKNNS